MSKNIIREEGLINEEAEELSMMDLIVGRPLEETIGGIYYIKPNYPGRSSHVRAISRLELKIDAHISVALHYRRSGWASLTSATNPLGAFLVL